MNIQHVLNHSIELRLDRGTLHGGHNYTVSCRAVRESDAAQV